MQFEEPIYPRCGKPAVFPSSFGQYLTGKIRTRLNNLAFGCGRKCLSNVMISHGAIIPGGKERKERVSEVDLGIDKSLLIAAEIMAEATEGGDFCVLESLADSCYGTKCLLTAQSRLKSSALYQKALHSGKEEVLMALAKMLREEEAHGKNYDETIEVLQRASHAGHTPSTSFLAEIYCREKMAKADFARAAGMFNLVAKSEDSNIACFYGDMLRDGLGVKQDYTGAVHYYTLATYGENHDACVKLGCLYEYGLGVSQDSDQAVNFYEMALASAVAGLLGAEATFDLAAAYDLGVLSNKAQAEILYRNAADRGIANAARALDDLLQVYALPASRCYDNTDPAFPNDFMSAVSDSYQNTAFRTRFAKECALEANSILESEYGDFHESTKPQGWQNMDTQCAGSGNDLISRKSAELAKLYEEGLEVERDYERSAYLYAVAADGGVPFAANALGIMFEEGRGISQNLPYAVEMYRKAAQMGHAPGTFNLGATYEYGRGVDVDLERAKSLYSLAVQRGSSSAKIALLELDQMTHEVFGADIRFDVPI